MVAHGEKRFYEEGFYFADSMIEPTINTMVMLNCTTTPKYFRAVSSVRTTENGSCKAVWGVPRRSGYVKTSKIVESAQWKLFS